MTHDKKSFAEITRSASKTFYFASLFFPKNVRNDVYVLYAFLRISDDLVDAIPPRLAEYELFKKNTIAAIEGVPASVDSIDAFVQLAAKKKIDKKNIQAYFASQDLDLIKRSYETYSDLCKFIYGVADVIGLFMAQVLDIPEIAHQGAQTMGHAMQLVNIIRDIQEDAHAGKVYLPQQELKRFGLPSTLDSSIIETHPKEFNSFIHFQLSRATALFSESKKSIPNIPIKSQRAIRIAAHAYEYMINAMQKNPPIIFQKKVRPTVFNLLIICIQAFIYG